MLTACNEIMQCCRGLHRLDSVLSVQLRQLATIATREIKGAQQPPVVGVEGSSQTVVGQQLKQETVRTPSQQPQPTASTSEPAVGQIRLKNASMKMPGLLGSKRAPIDVLNALQEVKDGARAKFDETVEVVFRLGTDPRRGDQQVRGATVLPHGTGKPVRVCVFCEPDNAELATAAGADMIGTQNTIAEIQAGTISFDKCLATASMMPSLSKVARVLGPRGLMPNPKLGTLVDPAGIAQAVKQMKGGRVEYRADKQANLHTGIGKVSFPVEHLAANLGALASAVLAARPKGVKGGTGSSGYLLSAHLSSTMGRGVPVTLPSVLRVVQQTKP